MWNEDNRLTQVSWDGAVGDYHAARFGVPITVTLAGRQIQVHRVALELQRAITAPKKPSRSNCPPQIR